jgi:hypothetical protein
MMIDDFEVPDDPGYQFDNYGERKVLTAAYLLPSIQSFKAVGAYPSLASECESGGRRGCIVLFTRSLEELLPRIPSLRNMSEICAVRPRTTF